MKGLRPLSIIILMLLVAWIAADLSGLDDYFNDMINERNGWKKGPIGYSRVTIVNTYWTKAAILKDPNSNKLSLYQGAIKKKALDRMEFLKLVIVEIKETDANLNYASMTIDKLKEEAKKNGANVVAIHSQGIIKSARSESFAM